METKLTPQQLRKLQRAEDLTAQAAGIIDDLMDELDDRGDTSGDNLQDAYDQAYGAMCTLSNIHLEHAKPILDGTAPVQSCTNE